MVEPVSLSIVIGILVNSAPGWFDSLQTYLVGKGKDIAFDQARQHVTSFFDKKQHARHMELALKNAAERGLARFHTSEERDRYRSVLGLLSEQGQHIEELRSEAMRLFTLSDTPDFSSLMEKYNRSQRISSLAHQQTYEEVDATPYLSSFFEALISELYNDPLFREQMSDVIKVRAALKGQQSLEDIITILRDVSSALTNNYNAEQFQKDIETYANFVESKFRRHTFAGIVFKGDEDKAPELDGIFVPLRVMPRDQSSSKLEMSNDILSSLEHSTYLVLLGGPGSGKSTTTRYLAWSHAKVNAQVNSNTPLIFSSKKPEVLSGKPVPLRIGLRLLSEARKQHAGYSFLSYTTEVMLGREDVVIHPQMFKELLERRGMLLLFDGLDEVATLAERQQLIGEIETFAQTYPGNRILVTSRPVGYDLASFADRLFQHDQIQDFDDAQIRQFLESWYTHVLKYSSLPTDILQELETFYTTLKDNERLHILAANPLLLTVMTALHRYERLPDKRVLLYEKCADLLLDTWAKVKYEDTRWEKMKMEKGDQAACLAHLGFVLHERSQETDVNGATTKRLERQSGQDTAVDVPARFMRQEIKRFLASQNLLLGAEQSAEAERFLELVRVEAGLIVARGTDEAGETLYGFVHRTFQEYFAAVDVYERYLQANDPKIISDFLKGCLHDPHWDEVILLLFGKLKHRFATNELRRILEGKSRLSSYTEVVKQDLFFVCDCLAEGITVETDFAEQVTSLVSNLVETSPFPSQRSQALTALGTLLRTRQYAALGRQVLKAFITEDRVVDVSTKIEAALILNINSQDETEQLEIFQLLLDGIQHSDSPFGQALRAVQTLYEYGPSRPETRDQMAQLLLSLAQSPSLSFEQARQVIEALDELKSSKPEVEQQATQFLLAFAQRPDLPIEQQIQAAEALYHYNPAGPEARRQVTQLLLALVQRADLSLEWVIQAARPLYRYTAPGSEERRQATERLVALIRKPDLPFEQVIQLVEFFQLPAFRAQEQERRQATERLVAFTQRPGLSPEQAIPAFEALYRYTASDSEERRQATEKLLALTQQHDLSLEQVIQIQEFFLEYGSTRSEERSRAVQYIEDLTRQSNASFEQLIQVYEFFYESGPASLEDRRKATQYLEELAGRYPLSVEQVISVAEFFSKSSRFGPREEWIAIQLLTGLIRRPDLSPEQIVQAIEAFYRLDPSGAVDERGAVQYLVDLIKRPDLTPAQLIRAAEALYRLGVYNVREQRLVVQQLVTLLRRPALPPEQKLQAVGVLYVCSAAESEDRRYALKATGQDILEQSIPLEQRLQAAAVPLTVREHNYPDRVVAVQMVLTLIQGEAAKKYLAEKWQQLPSRDRQLSPLREHLQRHAFLTHLPSVYELATLDVLPTEVQDEMYSILRTTVPRFADVRTAHH